MSCLDLLVTNLRGLSPTEFIFKVENFTDILEAHSVYNQYSIAILYPPV